MIVKRIPARPAGRNVTHQRAGHARRLVNYLHQPEKDSVEKTCMVDYMTREGLGDTRNERLFHVGAQWLVADTIEGHRLEMMALAHAAKRSSNPIDHWLLSWRENELPSAEQIDTAVEMFLTHLGVDRQPCVYAAHGDTHNRHVHIALNRYDVEADRMISINYGFNHEAAHQAVALIVDRFGWEAENGQRYRVENGEVVLGSAALARRNGGNKAVGTDAAAYELRTGYKSAQRIAQQEAIAILRAARSWSEAHARLAAGGMTYDKTGTNGAMIGVNDVRVKASAVHREVTRARLEKRLGVFEDRDPAIAITPRPIDGDRFADALRADEYRSQVEAHRAIVDQDDRRTPGRRRQGKPMRDSEDVGPSAKRPPPPNLESFYYHINEGELARHWRHRRTEGALPSLSGPSRSGVLTQNVDDYRPFSCADGIRYAHAFDAPTAFIDRGDRIDVVAGADDEAILAALRLAAIRFDGRMTVRGSDDFRERVFVVVQRNGLASFLADRDFRERQDRADRADRAHAQAHPPEPKPATLSPPRSPPEPSGSSPPAPEPASKTWVRPDHRQDHARVARVGELVALLQREAYLPLARTETIDASGKPVVRYELKFDTADHFDRRWELFRAVDLFDEDAALQAVFASKHRNTLEVAEMLLQDQENEGRERVRAGDFRDVNRGGEGLAEAFHLVRQTPEVSAMLARLEANWAERDIAEERESSCGRMAERGVTVTPARLPTGARGSGRADDDRPLVDPRRDRGHSRQNESAASAKKIAA